MNKTQCQEMGQTTLLETYFLETETVCIQSSTLRNNFHSNWICHRSSTFEMSQKISFCNLSTEVVVAD